MTLAQLQQKIQVHLFKHPEDGGKEVVAWGANETINFPSESFFIESDNVVVTLVGDQT